MRNPTSSVFFLGVFVGIITSVLAVYAMLATRPNVTITSLVCVVSIKDGVSVQHEYLAPCRIASRDDQKEYQHDRQALRLPQPPGAG